MFSQVPEEALRTIYLMSAVISILFASGLTYLIYYLRVNVFNPLGKGMEKKTAKTLRGFGSIREFKTLHNITLEADGKTAVIENMLVGYFGILLVKTCPVAGEYYGTLDGEKWTISRKEGSEKTTIPNPYLELKEAERLLRGIFSKNKVYNIPMESVVYMSSKAKKWGLFITHSGEIIHPGKLSSYLGKAKFERDTGLDIGQLTDIILASNRGGDPAESH